ncbi:MAG: PIG-L family deacetylase [Candidatus Eremiobacteraeota bacterium]|nr:PIG-L family deacetylase [Candidatus Eremiobacteraeota bacterium]
MKNKTILVVAAHPDDEILGCGGTIKRLVDEGCTAYTLILGEGITSRDEKRNRDERIVEIEELKKQVNEANRIIGVKEVFLHDFPDNRFDTVALLDIVKVIEKVKNELQPDIMFTHYENDLNIDHQITHKAVLTATRPMKGECVKELYSFEILSSTEWNYPPSFSPNVFFDISDYMEYKKKAMQIYKFELNDFPHPRSLEGMDISAKSWGLKVGHKYAEAFKTVRILK